MSTCSSGISHYSASIDRPTLLRPSSTCYTSSNIVFRPLLFQERLLKGNIECPLYAYSLSSPTFIHLIKTSGSLCLDTWSRENFKINCILIGQVTTTYNTRRYNMKHRKYSFLFLVNLTVNHGRYLE